MVTTAQEYNANLHLINNANPPIFAQLPSAENIYNIDVKTREIDAPQFLSVEQDHVAETIYFIVDRYADYMDLSTTSCIIYYINAQGKYNIYKVPFYDIYTFSRQKKMLIPWCLEKDVATTSGIVEFAIEFFRVEDVHNEITGKNEPTIVYSLHTLSAKSQVLKGLQKPNTTAADKDNFIQWEKELSQKIDNLKNGQQLKWTLLE